MSRSCVLRLLVVLVLHLVSDMSRGVVSSSVLSSSVEEAGVVNDSCVELHARGLGGSVPGEWFCNHCYRGGCWPARQRCFRCGMLREMQALVARPREKAVEHRSVRLRIRGEGKPHEVL